MAFLALLGRYFAWHYTGGLLACLRLWADFLWFIYHFFSAPVIMRTLFTPWRRLGEPYRSGFDPERALETFIVNLLMRLFGLVVRIIWLATASASLIGVFLLGLFVTVFFFFLLYLCYEALDKNS